MPAVPDVTVIVPVYNTMPYLTACLDSLVGQSIGAGRLHVVAVDDGSTDGSETELDRYAERHPELFTVVHQVNSGGPAAPCNRGLELATGRFVFFLGSDDYLADNALEKLVDRADEWGSDVMIGRTVGVGGRNPDQSLFERDEIELSFPHSRLPFALANSKLFRRSLLEEQQIRYPLDLRIGSDQPFTVKAMLHAHRISVLADQPYYFGVRRTDSSNISFSVGWEQYLADITAVVHHVAELLPPGEDRDALLHRHFTWEISKQLGPGFLELQRPDQEQICSLVRALADGYLTEGVSRRLGVGARLRIRLAQTHRIVALGREIAFLASAEKRFVALTPEGPKVVHPGFGELPDDWFDTTPEAVKARVRRSVQLSRVAWEGTSLVVEADTTLHPRSADSLRVALVPAKRVVRPVRRFDRGDEPPGHAWPVILAPAVSAEVCSTLTARLDLAGLLGDGLGPPGRRWALRFQVDLGDKTYDLPAEGAPGAATRMRVGLRFFTVRARRDKNGRMFVRRRRVPLRDVVRVEARRRLPSRRGR